MTRIGVIGGGFIGADHIAGFRDAGAIVAAIAEPRPDVRSALASQFDIPRTFPDGDQLIENAEVDAVSVCTPNDLHMPCTVAALKAGMHTLCEKPPALNAGQSAEMVRAARQSGKLLMMAFNQRFDPGIREMVRLNEQGAFGNVYHGRSTQIRQWGAPSGAGQWFRDAARAGAGVSFDLVSHAFYRAWYAMGKPRPASVSAAASRSFIEGTSDDFAAALVRFEGGKTLILEASWAAARIDEGKRTLIMGAEGGANYTAEKNQLVLLARHGDSFRESRLKLDNDPRVTKYAHFLDCIERGADCICPGTDGYIVQLVLDAIVASSDSSREMPVTIDEAVAPLKPET